MSYNVKTIDVFERQARKLIKKYNSIKQELMNLVIQLKENPTLGTSIRKDCFKVRMSIKSKGKGKSGGARIITNFVIADNTVYLLTIYDKSEKESLTDKELDELLRHIPL
jgi:mRNA-degrading endonuclease RelE of RelBE toxin-antitoxin system